MKMDVKLHTLGDSNHIDSDILRLTWVGDLEMHGVYPYTLVQGRLNSSERRTGIPESGLSNPAIGSEMAERTPGRGRGES